MSLIRCPECSKQISDSAPACPHCGKVLSTEDRATAKSTANAAAIGCFGLAVVAAVWLAVGGVFSPPTPQQEAATVNRDRRFNAIYACQEAIRRQLRAPATAKFPRETEMYVAAGADGIARAGGSVDAQNAFGALIRQRYVCELTPLSGNEFSIKSATVIP